MNLLWAVLATARLVRTWIVKQLFQVFSILCQGCREIETKTFVHTLRDRQNLSQNPWTESWIGREWRKNGSANFFAKLRQTWRLSIGKREIQILLFTRSIKSKSPDDLQLQQAKQWADQAQRDKMSLYGELEMRKRLFREHQAKDCQEIEELRRTCCEETDRGRQAKNDELSMHQERNPTTVSQLLTQIQDLQNEVNSPSDPKAFFYDLETASRSGATPRSQSTLCYSESQTHALRRFWIWPHQYTEYYGYCRKRFWTTTCSRRTNLHSLQ